MAAAAPAAAGPSEGPLRVLAAGSGLGCTQQPEALPGLQPPEGTEILKIALGRDFVLMLTALGQVLHAGSNYFGQRGDGTWDCELHLELHRVDLPPAVDIACGNLHALALLADGTVLIWGYIGTDMHGRIQPRCRGSGVSRPTGPCARAVAVEGLCDAVRAFAGRNYSFVLRSCGAVAAWGYNEEGELCLGTDETWVPAPRAVPALGGIGVIDIQCGGARNAALLADGGAVLWGRGLPRGCVTRISCGEGPYRSIAMTAQGCEIAADTSVTVVDRNGTRWVVPHGAGDSYRKAEESPPSSFMSWLVGRLLGIRNETRPDGREYLRPGLPTLRMTLEGSGAERVMERSRGTRAAWCAPRAEAACAAALTVLMEGVVTEGQTGATRMYLDLYNGKEKGAPPVIQADQVDDTVRAILLQCARIRGAAPEEDFQTMYTDLRALVDGACRTPLPSVNPVLRRVLLYWSAGPVGPPGADTNAQLDGERIEFCSWVNLALGRGYDPELMRPVVRYVRTLNQFCNTRAQMGLLAHWDRIRACGGQLYRGGGFDLAHRAWYERMAASQEPFRQLRGLSTTLKRDVAEGFAARAVVYGAQPVVWIIKINNRPPHCLQVNYFEPGLSLYTSEEEFLFQCRSVFFVVSVDFSSTPFVITLEAAVDNKHYSDYLPVAPRG